MKIIFNPMTGNFEPIPIIVVQIDQESLGIIDYGQQVGGDLSIDTGDRTNEISYVDQGLRIIDGNI
jgi:hypothetical protein